MERLADYIEERNALQAKVLTAFIYPAAISLVSVAIVIFLLSYVVPQVVTAFVQARQTLPMLTQVMLAASAFVRSWGVWVGWASLRWWWPGGWPCAGPSCACAGTRCCCGCRWSGVSCSV